MSLKVKLNTLNINTIDQAGPSFPKENCHKLIMTIFQSQSKARFDCDWKIATVIG